MGSIIRGGIICVWIGVESLFFAHSNFLFSPSIKFSETFPFSESICIFLSFSIYSHFNFSPFLISIFSS